MMQSLRLKLHNLRPQLPPIRLLRLLKLLKKVISAGVLQFSSDITSTTSNEVAHTCSLSSSTSLSLATSRNLEYNLDTSHARFCFLWCEGWTSWIYELHFFGFTHIVVMQHELPIFFDQLRMLINYLLGLSRIMTQTLFSYSRVPVLRSQSGWMLFQLCRQFMRHLLLC